MAQKRRAGNGRVAAKSRKEPVDFLADFVESLELRLATYKAKKGGSEQLKQAESLLRSLRFNLHFDFVFPPTVLAIQQAYLLGVAFRDHEAADIVPLLKREQKRMKNWRARSPIIGRGEAEWLLRRESEIVSELGYKPKRGVLDARLCLEFKEVYGRKVSPRTLRERLRGKNSNVANKNDSTRGRN